MVLTSHSLSLEIDKEKLRSDILAYLRALGFDVYEDGGRNLKLSFNQTDKAFLQRLHEPARLLFLRDQQEWIHQQWKRLRHFFANGSEIVPRKIEPSLVLVTDQWQHDLFRLARLTWSLPYSKGFGRRLRFLILDNGNQSSKGTPFLIGILALQSPPLSFPPRDKLFKYPPGRKPELVNQTMDIQTLGALPPYNDLLGGKLVALVAASNEVRKAYQERYHERVTEIEQRILPSHLVALTTTSAFGRSSIYNRLKYKDKPIAISLGYTSGYGAFHLEPFYYRFRHYLESLGISTRGGYGVGPRIKWQTCVRALHRLGLSGTLLQHSVPREAFLFPLVENLIDYMQGSTNEPVYRDLPFSDLVAYWKERWLEHRFQRINRWREWRADDLTERLFVDDDDPRLRHILTWVHQNGNGVKK